VLLSLLAAVTAAFGYGASTVMQAVAARRAQGLAVVRQPLVILAFAVDLVAWLFSLVALDHLPLFVVQAVLASSLVVTVLLARAFLSAPMRRVDVVAIVAIVGALVVLGFAGGEQPAPVPPDWFAPVLITTSVGLAVVALIFYPSGAPVLLAVIGALGYSGAAVAARGAHASGDIGDTILQPLAIAIVIFGVVGALAYLRSLERGRVGANAAILSVIEVVVPGAVGIVVLGDTIRSGWDPAVAVAALVALVGCVVLATSPANEAAESGEASDAVGPPKDEAPEPA
jgi:drug/metabolite transporter (DMT)-like permease